MLETLVAGDSRVELGEDSFGAPITVGDRVLQQCSVAGQQAEIDAPGVDPDAVNFRPEAGPIGRIPFSRWWCIKRMSQ